MATTTMDNGTNTSPKDSGTRDIETKNNHAALWALVGVVVLAAIIIAYAIRRPMSAAPEAANYSGSNVNSSAGMNSAGSNVNTPATDPNVRYNNAPASANSNVPANNANSTGSNAATAPSDSSSYTNGASVPSTRTNADSQNAGGSAPAPSSTQ